MVLPVFRDLEQAQVTKSQERERPRHLTIFSSYCFPVYFVIHFEPDVETASP